ncbi:MAG: bifunctional 4-hydroxy-2-oxoglutarate aldolase/2-dehydro-3-deoxy-phosphogluconate aldolase [bacterium]
MDVRQFRKLPIMGILRGVQADTIEPLVETVVSAGLRTMEINMNTKGAAKIIHRAVRVAKERLIIGAGTVLDMRSLKNALDAGATFIVMPVMINEVVEYCVDNRIAVFPGALTPQEIYRAWQAGATMVKVFPSPFFGPAYLKEIKGPFQDIELMACGGIKPENIKSYFASGASAVAFGGSIFRKEWLMAGEFSHIGKAIKDLIKAYRI